MTEKSQSVFDHTDYRKYLETRLPISGAERGLRTKLAHALQCQTAFVSRVIHGEAHFSLEHSIKINRFLGHTEEEGEYFMLLVHYSRAGSADLEQHYLKQIQRIQEKRQIISERIQVKQSLSPEDQMIYYSTWHYAAIHVLLLIPEFQTAQAISQHLGIPLPRVTECLEFLVSVGLAQQIEGRFVPGTSRIHLKRGSPMFPKHHANWRMRSIQALDEFSNEDLFFSGPIVISEQDALKIKGKIMKLLEESEKIIGPSANEAMFCFSVDFFRM